MLNDLFPHICAISGKFVLGLIQALSADASELTIFSGFKRLLLITV
jgi:hypothetical protein